MATPAKKDAPHAPPAAVHQNTNVVNITMHRDQWEQLYNLLSLAGGSLAERNFATNRVSECHGFMTTIGKAIGIGSETTRARGATAGAAA